MKRRRIILGALAAVLLAVAASIAVWHWAYRFGLSTPIEMVEIQPGEFMMGSPKNEVERFNNETQHLVKITDAFKMGKYEVTQKQWHEVMGTTIQQQRDKAQRNDEDWTFFGERLKLLVEAIKDDPIGTFDEIRDEGVWKTTKALVVGEERWPLSGEGDNYPMCYVNWDEAAEFCLKLSELERAAGRLPEGQVYRLPAETEWEYACRAGSTTQFANGDTEADLDKIGWHDGNSGGTTHPVGTKIPNAWGLHDMHGNVWEWCLDWGGDHPAEEAVDPFGPATRSLCVQRGGGWGSHAWLCRSATRSFNTPSDTSIILGFRATLVPQD